MFTYGMMTDMEALEEETELVISSSIGERAAVIFSAI